jgi:hypothetical protein
MSLVKLIQSVMDQTAAAFLVALGGIVAGAVVLVGA